MTDEMWGVRGPAPDDESDDPPTTLLEVFKDEHEAEVFLANVLMTSAGMAVQKVKPGGTFSLMLTRGHEGFRMTGGFALNNPDEKHRADYSIVRMTVIQIGEPDE